MSGTEIDLTEGGESALSVLVVDDDPSIRGMLELLLQLEGFDVRVVADGTEALDEVFWSVPDVVVLDVMMPGLDGREVTRAMREDPRTRDVPVVICSAMTSDDEQWLSWSSGADSFVAKPFEVEELIAEMRRVVDARRTG